MLTIGDFERKLFTLPTQDEWNLKGDPETNKQLVELLNSELECILKEIIVPKFSHYQICAMISERIKQIEIGYPDCGITSWDSNKTIAHFFSKYYDLDIYDRLKTFLL